MVTCWKELFECFDGRDLASSLDEVPFIRVCTTWHVPCRTSGQPCVEFWLLGGVIKFGYLDPYQLLDILCISQLLIVLLVGLRVLLKDRLVVLDESGSGGVRHTVNFHY